MGDPFLLTYTLKNNQLWKYDGNNNQLIKDFSTQNQNIQDLDIAADNTLYAIAEQHIWQVDGSGQLTSYAALPSNVSSKLMFDVSDYGILLGNEHELT